MSYTNPEGEGISVIIPLYNKQDTIERTIKSVLNQTYKNYEIIIVDDGSTDNSNNIVRNFTDKIIIISQPNSGVSVARNNGACKAKYQLLAFLDADDEWDERYLEIIMKMRQNYPESAFYATGSGTFSNRLHNVELPSIRSSNNKTEVSTNTNFTTYCMYSFESFFAKFSVSTFPLQTPAVVITKKSFFSVGGFVPFQRQYEDWDLYYRLLFSGDLVYLPICLVKVNTDASNRLSTLNSKIKLTAEQTGLVKIANCVSNGEYNFSKSVNMFLFNILLTIGIHACLISNYKLAATVVSIAERYGFKSNKYSLLKWILIFRIPAQFLRLGLNIKLITHFCRFKILGGIGKRCLSKTATI